MTLHRHLTCGLVRPAALCLAAAALLAGCGGGGGDGGATQPQPVVTSAEVGTVRYNQSAVLTLTGADLDLPIIVTTTGCRNLARSTVAPFASTATRAYYTCTVSAVGAYSFNISRGSDGTALASAAYTVPVPQVTMAISNGAGVNGNVVITLTPQQTPITVDNLLAYVNSGFYNGTVFHRNSPNFVLQGGGFAQGLNPANAVPALKPTSPTIVLEDNAGLSNARLTVSMARLPAPDTASSQFFINLADNLGLNRTPTARGYAVFGSITAGADVVTAMTGAPCAAYPALVGAGECTFMPNMVITSALQTR
jgi:cyclophilin family peptidyl-prolyl cis-trans isomerase